MATATERWSDNTLSKDANGWRATRAFDVIEAASETAALAASGIPAINEAHPNSTRQKCLRVEATPTGPATYRVIAYYEIPTDGNEHFGAGYNNDPVLQPPRLRWETVSETVQIEHDLAGNAITNSARDPFEQPPTRRAVYKRLTVTLFDYFFPATAFLLVENKVNSLDWAIPGEVISAGEAFCASVQPTTEYTADAKHVELAYTFWVRALPVAYLTNPTDPWQLRVLDQGYNKRLVGDTAPRKILDVDGSHVSTPQLLDGTGGEYFVAGSGIGTPTGASAEDTGTGVFLHYTVYGSYDFNLLNLFANV